jgi:hypothetical protein
LNGFDPSPDYFFSGHWGVKIFAKMRQNAISTSAWGSFLSSSTPVICKLLPAWVQLQLHFLSAIAIPVVGYSADFAGSNSTIPMNSG